MAKTREDKKQLLQEYSKRIKNSKGLIIVKPRSVKVNEITVVKKGLYDLNSEYRVVKNTLFKLALTENGYELHEDLNNGEHAIVFMNEDISSPAKLMKKYSKDLLLSDKKSSKIELIGGYYEGSLLNKEQVEELADMPDKRGSISMILGIIDQSLSGVVNVLEDAPRSFVTIIDQAFNK